VSGDPATATTPGATAEDHLASLEMMAQELDEALTGGEP